MIYDPSRGLPIDCRFPEQPDWKTLGLARPAPVGIKPHLWKKLTTAEKETWLVDHDNGNDDIDPLTKNKYEVIY